MMVHTLFKRPRALPKIEFTEKDLAGVHCPHEDALVVTLRVSNYDVRRVLINNGNAVNVIFLDTLRKMDLICDELSPQTQSS